MVDFSVDRVYEMAEHLRTSKVGSCVGSTFSKTRNAQVELYQNGDVDHIVATDAHGVNLPINNVYFAKMQNLMDVVKSAKYFRNCTDAGHVDGTQQMGSLVKLKHSKWEKC